jgi:RNA polymerase sigma factor (sigma-70 family)
MPAASRAARPAASRAARPAAGRAARPAAGRAARPAAGLAARPAAAQSGERRADECLVRAVLAGDRERFADLVTRHAGTAHALAARLLGTADLARDAVQEAAVVAMLSLDRLRAPEKFGAWFCGITLNVSRRWLRELRAELPVPYCDGPALDSGPDELAEVAEISALVRSAIAALPAGQREAVRLFYLHGLTHREVAAELGITVGAVKARLHQARRSLEPGLADLADLVGPARPDHEPKGRRARMTTTEADQDWTEVTVTEVVASGGEQMKRRHVIVLRERGGERELPIWVGPAEALALAMSLESITTERPLTYQMAARLAEAAGARVAEVRITRLDESVFYASVVVDGPAGRREVDARPSDAVNLALTVGAPVRVAAALLGDPGATRDADWRDYPAHTDQLAAEVRELLTKSRVRRSGPAEPG